MQEKKQIITIAGKPGSGKSTTSKLLADRLEYERFSSGDLMRTLGKERGLDIYATNIFAESDTSLDTQVDERLKEIGSTEDKLVIDSRMAWHWMPYSFRVHLELDLEIAANRILSDLDESRRKSEQIPDNPIEYAELLKKRLASESKRYLDLYNADPHDLTQYDLVVDTAAYNQTEVADLITEAFQAWLVQ